MYCRTHSNAFRRLDSYAIQFRCYGSNCDGSWNLTAAERRARFPAEGARDVTYERAYFESMGGKMASRAGCTEVSVSAPHRQRGSNV